MNKTLRSHIVTSQTKLPLHATLHWYLEDDDDDDIKPHDHACLAGLSAA